MTEKKCLLLFSGGRDSTVSAVYLASQYDYLNLITIKSEHLVGAKNVYKRLEELKPILKDKCTWEFYQKMESIKVQHLKPTTCLPCHAYYIALMQNIAISNNIQNVSLGYVGYQNCWEEQTEYAKLSLKKYFEEIGLNLLLPVENIKEKEEIKRELKKNGLSEKSLEQKCLKATYNLHLKVSEIEEQINIWISEIKRLSVILKENYKSTQIDKVNL